MSLLLLMDVINGGPALLSSSFDCLKDHLAHGHINLTNEPLIISKDGGVLKIPDNILSLTSLCAYSQRGKASIFLN